MKIGITGLPQSGKMTLFEILTESKRPEFSGAAKVIPGVADIIDTRFDTLVQMYEPKKNVKAKIDLALLPKLEKDAIAKGDIFRDIADMDALCHVVRGFEDDAVYHVDGSVDPSRDIQMVNAELLMHDQIFIEKRIERLEISLKKLKDEKQLKELEVIKKLLAHLEEEKPLRLIDLVPDEEIFIRSYPLITRKEMIIAINIGEDDIGSWELPEDIAAMCETEKMSVMHVSAQVESEIAMLESDEEKQEFMDELDIKEMALETLTRLCLDGLGLISFFTVGKDEVRQWLVRKGAVAPEAAGVIHSDLQRGFIRAEVIKYSELMEYKSEAELKKAGMIYINGKDYNVEDGDILNIRFKV